MADPRYDWTREEIAALYGQPFLELVYEAQTVHRHHFKSGQVQKSTLLSIKTGGCPEDCAYCPQSAHYQTGVAREGLLPLDEVKSRAREAKSEGSTRFCMGAAWREVPEGKEFDHVLEMVREVASLDMEVCCTLGMLTDEQASRLKDAGLTAYNHNLDTSPEYYDEIITTRTYEDRLQTLQHVRDAGIQVCCGGIIGMGESVADRIGLLHQLATQNPHPESVPINMLVRVEGTPLAKHRDLPEGYEDVVSHSIGTSDRATGVERPSEGEDMMPAYSAAARRETRCGADTIEWIRTIATARILMPKSYVRLSAGRLDLSDEAQALAFMAGANSIFTGEKLLTTPNPETDRDTALFAKLGLTPLPTSS